MLLGKPVIATAYRGNIEFMNEANHLLVSYEKVPLKRDHTPFLSGCSVGRIIERAGSGSAGQIHQPASHWKEGLPSRREGDRNNHDHLCPGLQ